MVLNIYSEYNEEALSLERIVLRKVVFSPIDMVITWKYNDVSELRCVLPVFKDLKITEDMFLCPQGEEVYNYNQNPNTNITGRTLFYIDSIKIVRRGGSYVYIIQAFDCIGLLKRRATVNEYFYADNAADLLGFIMETHSAITESADAQKQRALPFYSFGASYGHTAPPFGETRYFYTTVGQSMLDAALIVAKATNSGIRTEMSSGENAYNSTYYSYFGTQRDGAQASVAFGARHVTIEEELGNISDAEYQIGAGNYANVLYVHSPGVAGWPWKLYTMRVVGNTYQIINPNAPPPVVSTHPSGMKRYEAGIAGPSRSGGNGAELTNAQMNPIMLSFGMDQLANRKKTRLVSGTITDTGAYRIMRDFWIGDIVEVKSTRFDILMNARVTAFIQDFSGGHLKNRIEIGDPAPTYSDSLRLKDAAK